MTPDTNDKKLPCSIDAGLVDRLRNFYYDTVEDFEHMQDYLMEDSNWIIIEFYSVRFLQRAVKVHSADDNMYHQLMSAVLDDYIRRSIRDSIECNNNDRLYDDEVKFLTNFLEEYNKC